MVHEVASRAKTSDLAEIGIVLSRFRDPTILVTGFAYTPLDYILLRIAAEGKVLIQEAIVREPFSGLTGYGHLAQLPVTSGPVPSGWDWQGLGVTTNEPTALAERTRTVPVGSERQQQALQKFLVGASLLADVQRILVTLENDTLCIDTLIRGRGNETRRKVYRLEQETFQEYEDADLFFRLTNLADFPGRAWNEFVPSEARIAYEKVTWRTDAQYEFTLATGR